MYPTKKEIKDRLSILNKTRDALNNQRYDLNDTIQKLDDEIALLKDIARFTRQGE